MLHLLVYGLLAISTHSQLIVDYSCTVRTGRSVRAAGAESRAVCLSGETLVSCGINGWHNIAGTSINPGAPKVCRAYSSGGDFVSAVANCCTFPRGSVSDVTTVLAGPDIKVTAKCPSGSTITGCQVRYDSGNTNQIRGSYVGVTRGRHEFPKKSTTQPLSTRNQCNAESRADTTNVVGGAQCVTFDEDVYKMKCVMTSEWTTRSGYGQANCPSGYKLIACNTFTTTHTLDDWYLQSNGLCYIQQDNWDPMYGNGICCQLRKKRVIIQPGKAMNDNDDIGYILGKGNNKKVRRNGRKRFVLYGEPISGPQSFPLSIILDKLKYGFTPSDADSELAFTVKGRCREPDCNMVTVIGIGTTQYISIATTKSGDDIGMSIYPPCGGAVANGFARALLDGVTGDDPDNLLDAVAGGDSANFADLGVVGSAAANTVHFPFTVQIINNDVSGSVTVNIASVPLTGNTLSCTYSGALDTETVVSINLSPQWSNGDAPLIGIPAVILYDNRFSVDSLGSVSRILEDEILIGDDEEDEDEEDEDDMDDEEYWSDYTKDEEFVFMKQGEIGTNGYFELNLDQGMMGGLVVFIGAIGVGLLYRYCKNTDYQKISNGSEQETRPFLVV